MVRGLTRFGTIAAVVPATVLTVWTMAVLVGATVGAHPIWRVEPVNLSEAAALRDQATVVKLIRDGEDPSARREVRADLLFNDRVELTALEAGIASHRSEIVDILMFSMRTPPDATEWNRLRCLADLEGDRDVIEVLNRYRPASDALSCTGVTRPWK